MELARAAAEAAERENYGMARCRVCDCPRIVVVAAERETLKN